MTCAGCLWPARRFALAALSLLPPALPERGPLTSGGRPVRLLLYGLRLGTTSGRRHGCFRLGAAAGRRLGGLQFGGRLQRGAILLQFLIEAVTLTGIGGAIGLFIGWGVAVLVRQYSPIAASVPPMAVVAALGASAVTGVLFGMLPAMRASRLDPVDALRYE